jgi:hypothetical protein
MTKAERFQIAQQRAAQARHASERKRAPGKQRARPAAPRKPSVPNPASHNEHARAARYGLYEHEISATTRPSRKSSRKSPARIKTDSPLRLTAMNRNASPKYRSRRPSGNPN